MRRSFLVVIALAYVACQQRNEKPLVVTSDVTATVIFKGLITHFRDAYQRAAIVYTATHNHEVRLPYTSDIQKVVVNELAGTCVTDCVFNVKYMSLTLLDASKNPLTGDLIADSSFDKYVTKLSTVDATAFDKSQLQQEATGAVIPSSTISWGYFDLHGGSATATALTCQGKFDPDGAKPYFDFPDDVIIAYTLTGGGYLRVTDSAGAHDIPLAGSKVFIKVNNDIQSSNDHFQEYAKLSKMNPTLPPIIRDLQGTCKLPESGGIPGCSDTQWP